MKHLIIITLLLTFAIQNSFSQEDWEDTDTYTACTTRNGTEYCIKYMVKTEYYNHQYHYSVAVSSANYKSMLAIGAIRFDGIKGGCTRHHSFTLNWKDDPSIIGEYYILLGETICEGVSWTTKLIFDEDL